MMVKINCHFEDKKLMEIFNVTQEIIDIAKITWISGHFMTDILSGSIIIDANNYKQYLKNTI